MVATKITKLGGDIQINYFVHVTLNYKNRWRKNRYPKPTSIKKINCENLKRHYHTGRGCFDDTYFSEPHESLCSKTYTRYYNWKNDDCKKNDHSIYDYDCTYFDLCHKQNSYITRHEHYNFCFQVLSMLKPGMLCYYRVPQRYGDRKLICTMVHITICIILLIYWIITTWFCTKWRTICVGIDINIRLDTKWKMARKNSNLRRWFTVLLPYITIITHLSIWLQFKFKFKFKFSFSWILKW